MESCNNNERAVSSICEDSNSSNSSIGRHSASAGGPSNKSSSEQEPFHERDIQIYAPHMICHCNTPALTTESIIWHVSKDLMQRLFKCEACKKYSIEMSPKMFEKELSQKDQDQFKPPKSKTAKNYYRKPSSPLEENIFSYEKLYSCSVCNKWFTDHLAITKHLQCHETAKTHNCNLCEKSFLNKGALNSHISCHKEVKSFKCLECGKMFTRKWYLKEHRYMHTKEKRYICHLCGKKFLYKNSLTSHLLVHEGKKRFGCDTCNRKFISRSCLYNHLKIHNGIKRFECDICKKNFQTKSQVVTHLLVHFGEKVYSCRMCDNSFAYKGSLRTHYLQVHSLDKTEYHFIIGVKKSIN